MKTVTNILTAIMLSSVRSWQYVVSYRRNHRPTQLKIVKSISSSWAIQHDNKQVSPSRKKKGHRWRGRWSTTCTHFVGYTLHLLKYLRVGLQFWRKFRNLISDMIFDNWSKANRAHWHCIAVPFFPGSVSALTQPTQGMRQLRECRGNRWDTVHIERVKLRHDLGFLYFCSHLERIKARWMFYRPSNHEVLHSSCSSRPLRIRAEHGSTQLLSVQLQCETLFIAENNGQLSNFFGDPVTPAVCPWRAERIFQINFRMGKSSKQAIPLVRWQRLRSSRWLCMRSSGISGEFRLH